MTTLITTLIDKDDTVETVRDQIAAILAANVVAQRALATAAGEDPDLWKLRIYLERANPWEAVLNEQTDFSPIVNIWVDSGTFEKGASNTFQRQKTTTTFNLDCYGFGTAEADGTGHKPGDREAAFEAHRAVKLTRNILMASCYTYLDLRGTVWSRWIRTISFFQPQIDQRPIVGVVGGRIVLDVEFSETSPQYEPVDLEEIKTDITRASDGEVLAEIDKTFTP